VPLEKIEIRRINNKVDFTTVTVFENDNVFFSNLDTVTHKPSICNEDVLPPPSPKSVSSQCVVNGKAGTTVTYTCLTAGHQNESGTINVKARPTMP